jgi:phosphoglycolate phosphatase-like HAD superfamily hydrolase
MLFAPRGPSYNAHMPDKHRLILFDIDGTLLRTHGAGRLSTRDAMLEIFGAADGLDAHSFGGKTDWQTLVELLAAHGYDERRVGDMMPVYEQAIARHLTRIIIESETIALPGALEAVTHLLDDRATVMGIVTGNVSTTAPIKLRAAGFDPAWFPVGAYGSERMLRDHLPALALERAIAHAGRDINPSDVIVIGDTVADIQCARAVGAKAVAVCTGFEPVANLENARPDVLLDDLTTLLHILA